MDTNTTSETPVGSAETPQDAKPKKPRRPRFKPDLADLGKHKVTYRRGQRPLTPTEKAEAAALWRSGEMTLEQIAKQLKRRPETLSRLFQEMGIKKGEAAEEHQKKVQAEIEAKLLTDVAEHAARIAKVKEQHFKMADGLGRLIWSELVAAKQQGKSIERLRGTMHTLQMASAALSNVRKEIYDILRIDEFDSKDKEDELPELRIAELSPGQIDDLRRAESARQGGDDLDVGDGPAEDLPDDDSDAGGAP